MNGGQGSRPCCAYAPSTRPGAWFLRDVRILLSARGRIAGENGYRERGGKALLWLEPWDGRGPLPLSDCDPFFIEVCRRVRLQRRGEHVLARTTTTDSARLDASERKGVTGDPWTPVHRAQGKALTIGAGGLSSRLLQELMFSGEYQPGVAGELHPDDGPEVSYVASVLVRGQGRTEGWHERVIPVPHAFADPAVHAGCDWNRFAGKLMPGRWEPSVLLGFEVRTCPTVRLSNERPGRAKKGAEVDAFLARCWTAGEGAPVDREEVYREWLARELARDGAAELISLRMKSFHRVPVLRRTQAGPGQGRRGHLQDRPEAVLEGTLRIRDGAAFSALLRRGVGRQRAFGFGMMLLRPAVEERN